MRIERIRISFLSQFAEVNVRLLLQLIFIPQLRFLPFRHACSYGPLPAVSTAGPLFQNFDAPPACSAAAFAIPAVSGVAAGVIVPVSFDNLCSASAILGKAAGGESTQTEDFQFSPSFFHHLLAGR